MLCLLCLLVFGSRCWLLIWLSSSVRVGGVWCWCRC